MDTTLTVGENPTLTGTAVTETPEQTTGAGDAVPEQKPSEGGEGQPNADDSQKQDGGRRKFTQLDQIKELRAERRELRERLSAFDDVRNELAQLREQLNRQNQTGAAKTPANFWQDPEARLQSLRDELKDIVAEQNQGLMAAFHQTREQEYAEQALSQERVSAVEFIRSQKGYDASDDEELAEIIREIPKRTLEASSPQMVAEYAWLKYQAERGVGDRGLAKRQASSVQGQPPGVGFGRKMWNKAEFDQAVDLVDQRMRKNPNDPEMNKLFDELQSAHKEGRVK